MVAGSIMHPGGVRAISRGLSPPGGGRYPRIGVVIRFAPCRGASRVRERVAERAVRIHDCDPFRVDADKRDLPGVVSVDATPGEWL